MVRSRSFKSLAADHQAMTNKAATGKTAVVVGAAGGIGQACANRLAEAGFSVVAVGRDRPGRAEAVVSELNSRGGGPHEFRSCDAFSLKDVKECADGIVKDKGTVDALVMTQGMATVQGFTPTEEGNDEKLTLHCYSRFAFAYLLLPALRNSVMEGGPVVMSVLSGGVHSPFRGYKTDPELKDTYSIKNAADAAGYYNDLFFDALSRKAGNGSINFIHSAPGFVNSNWGTEMPWYLRGVIRCMQPLGKTTTECAEFMADPVLRSAAGEQMLDRPDGAKDGVFIMNEDATAGKLTKEHTADALDTVWKTVSDVLKRVGIDIDN
mmetsp:Transcript_14717/g.32792  ORF Transcript_14717/g.32792 Transcript_14717/m.32792 type:complete len:322 (-) Transcript_14717:1461-2426(-)